MMENMKPSKYNVSSENLQTKEVILFNTLYGSITI